MYVGGDGGLLLLKRKTINHAFSLMKEDRSLRIYGLRGTPSGHIVVQIQGSNNLLVFDKNLNLELEFKGKDRDINRLSDMYREPHFSYEGKRMFWFGSKSDLYTVDLTTLA